MAGKEENRTCEGTNDVFKVWNWNVLNDTLIQGLKSLRSWRCCLREAKAKSKLSKQAQAMCNLRRE